MTRTFHNVTSKYNVFFNANLSYENGLMKVERSFRDDYTKILPVFIYSDSKISKSVAPEMNRTIEKTSKLISRHSITVKPEKNKKKKLSDKEKEFLDKKEYTKWVDDAYLLLGKAHFHKHDFYPAIETFSYVVKEYSKNRIKFEALIWLSRTYIELKNYGEAIKILDQLDGDKNFPKDYRHDYLLTKVHYFVKQNKFEDAIPLLRSTVQNETVKSKKARYYYILAQINELKNNIEAASYNYGEVVKLNPEYEMLFNARINRARLYDISLSGSKEIKKELEKMLKDDKNIEYQDQVYYALANIYQKEENIDLAIENYKLSVKVSVSNDNQKAISFLAIANHYFSVPEYKEAQAYYDSAVSFLDDEFLNYDVIFNKSRSLNELVDNLNIVEREDSLQRIAQMDEATRSQFILALIEEVKEEEQRLIEEQTQNALLMQQGLPAQSASAGGSGKWYFYNPVTLGLGQSEFTKLWGRRKMEDNWRRKNKAISAFGEGGDLASVENADTNEYNNKQPEYYLQDLPLTDSLMKISDENIALALFNMAKVYKEKLKDYEQSIKIFKDLNERFPENQNALSAYYYIYLLNKEIKNEAAAEYYKRLIATNYPESQYASILTNPNYFKEMEEKENEIIKFYNETYNFYQQNNFDKVIANYNYADTAYPENDLMPKFDYLRTLVTGRTSDIEVFEKELELIVEKYPYSEIRPEAENIIAYINRDEEETVKEKSLFDEETDEEIEESEEEIYEFDKRSTHFYMIVVENIKTDVNQIKFGIANFNIDYFSTLEFNISSALLNDEFQFVTVKSFKNRNQAMNYYESITEFGEFFGPLDPKSYRQFVISSENYVKFYKDKNINKYYRFFKSNYLKE
ncbi:tetratricopeptide repeat protein [Bacteroidota bacterium]